MGNDGGSIPDRRDLVRTKPKAEQADKANQTRAKWFFCALSKRKLQEPIVSCGLGKLYNKDAILEYLLDKSGYGDGEKICGHIRSLKEVKMLKLTPKSTRTNNGATADKDTENLSRFVCPFTLKEMNGTQPFLFIWTCGCVFSQAGFRTVASSSSSSPSPPSSGENDATVPKDNTTSFELCPQCNVKYCKATDILTLNPSPEEEDEMRPKMEARRSAAIKTSKKRKAPVDESASTDKSQPSKKQSTNGARPHMNPSVVAASRAVVESLAAGESKRKERMSSAVKSLYESDGPKRKETWMTRTFNRYAA